MQKRCREVRNPMGGGWDRPGEAYTARSFRGFGRNARFDDVGNLALLIIMSDGVRSSSRVPGTACGPRP